MTEETKKISFGFSKLVKKTQIVSSRLNEVKPEKNKVELIDCLEGKTIKLKDPIQSEDKVLIIPLKRKQEVKDTVNDQTSSTNLTGPINNQNIGLKEALEDLSSPKEQLTEKESTLLPPPSKDTDKCLTLDEIAAKEILEDLNKQETQKENRVFTVPLTSNAPLGEKESSLEDYENIPVGDFGLAMLRGMGWAPGKGIGKNEKLVSPSVPTLRPKGMGLGADKVIKIETANTANSEDLKMVKGSFIRVVAGSHKDSYGQIEGFDDEGGRLVVKLAIKNLTLSLNEFMIQLVSKTEFLKNSKVINVVKYEQYKDNENKTSLENAESENKPTSKSDIIRPNKDDKHNNTKSKPERRSKRTSSSPENQKRSTNEKQTRFEDSSRKYREKTNKVQSRGSYHSQSPKRQQCSSSDIDVSSKTKELSYSEKNSIRSYSSSPEDRHRHSSKNKPSVVVSESKKRQSSKHKKVKHRSSSPSSSCSSSDSIDYYRKAKHGKKKRAVSHESQSRSRSRSPRKHSRSSGKKHKSSKRHKSKY